MNNTTATIEKLIEKTEIYAQTTLKLCKYEAIYKLADTFSTLAVKLSIAFVAVMFLMLANIGLSLWIGQLMGHHYYGFFVVAFVYLCLAILLHFFRDQWIKKPVSNFIIDEIQNDIITEN
jgi:sterol desaturase/sphingolipid hydroxylase (fatty acid hydroxylase superfamily)